MDYFCSFHCKVKPTVFLATYILTKGNDKLWFFFCSDFFLTNCPRLLRRVRNRSAWHAPGRSNFLNHKIKRYTTSVRMNQYKKAQDPTEEIKGERHLQNKPIIVCPSPQRPKRKHRWSYPLAGCWASVVITLWVTCGFGILWQSADKQDQNWSRTLLFSFAMILLLSSSENEAVFSKIFAYYPLKG